MSHRPGFQVPANRVTKRGRVQLEFDDPDRYRALLARLKADRVTVTVEKEVKAGSAKQRGYYFAVIVETLAEYWGLDEDDAHELIKLHCNKKIVEVVNKETGEVEEQTIGASTSGMNTEQWALFIERCQRWAAMEFHVVLPNPDPEWMFNRSDAA